MSIRTILLGLGMLALALAPSAALADLQVNAPGFERVVTSSTQGDSCTVAPLGTGSTVSCPDGSRGTLVLYRHADESPVCEVDFWYEGNASGVQRWRAQVSHQNATYGTCSTHWNGAATLDLAL